MQERRAIKTTKSKLPPRGWKKNRGLTVYKPQPPSRFRRFLRLIFNGWTLSLFAIFLLFAFLTLTYYWFDFSDKIDRRLLSGEVFTPTAGIYSAPKTLRIGEDISLQGLIDYLKSAGYIEKNERADASRSRYSVAGDTLTIEPGVTGTIDGQKVFPALTVKFKKDLKSIAAIANKDSGAMEQQVKLEPKMLSSIAAEGDGRRKTVKFDDLPRDLVKAITVTEDRAFFEHYGVNFRGIARALWVRYEGEENTPLSNQGGSSITQQLVKNMLLTNDPTYERKLTEAYMSVILETRLSKQEIFTLYANQIYLGQQAGVSIYGVGEAADAYFGKDVTQLTLPEAAFIAGIIRSPNRYNPFKNPEKVTERRNQVLESMHEAGEISDAQLADARSQPINLKPISNRKDLQGMPYFSQYAIEELPKIVADPEALQHLRVYTSIDPDLQRLAYETVSKRLDALDKFFPKKPKGSLNAALVAIRPKTGEIVAMVGGRDYFQNQFNRATDAMRQPGSVFKPFVYTTAINSAYDGVGRVFTPATIFKDEKKVFTYGTESYSPGNFGDFFSNQDMTLRDALVKSKNVITVDLAMQLNVGRVMNLAAKAGMPKVDKAYPSMALGTAEATPLQVATAYTMFANLGDRILPTPITQVTYGDGRTVAKPSPERKNVIRPDVAYVMDDMMKDVINRGTAAHAQQWGFKNVDGKTGYAGKTGTSRDGWFAGFTPELVCVVYVGFDNGDDLNMTGGDSALPIWADFMRGALDQHPDWNGDWSMPAGVKRAEIDIRSGKVLKELDPAASLNIKDQENALNRKPDDGPVNADDEQQSPEADIYEKDVPAEFRRIELFITGTIPNKSLADDQPTDENVQEIPPVEGEVPSPSPTGTPIDGTWQDDAEPPTNVGSNRKPPQRERERTVSVMVCPLTGMRATANCPTKELRTYPAGSEPKEFCTFHVRPPK
jgi:penicillin-binding protein 1B